MTVAAPPRIPGPPRLRVVPAPDPEPVRRPLRPAAAGLAEGLAGRHEQLRLDLGEAPDGNLDQAPEAGAGAPEPFAGTVCQAIVDVIAGLRPAQQIVRWLRPDVLEELRRRTPVTGGGPVRRPVVRRVVTCEVDPDTVEVAAVVVDGRRARAIALRLERFGDRWRVTALGLM